MPSPSTLFLFAELLLIFVGCGLLWRFGLNRASREQPARLAFWPAAPSEFFLFVWLAIAGALLAPVAAGHWVKAAKLGHDLELIVNTGIFQLGMLLGVVAYHVTVGRRRPAPPSAPFPSNVFAAGLAVHLMSLPVVLVVSLLWQGLLKLCGIDAPQQETIDLLRNATSIVPVAILVTSAVVVAPMAEEMVFRAGIFRYVRGRLPRWAALTLPAFIFGLMHANLASFVPLMVLGIVYSLAYERTGRIGTTMVAHALFNLTATLLVMVGIAV